MKASVFDYGRKGEQALPHDCHDFNALHLTANLNESSGTLPRDTADNHQTMHKHTSSTQLRRVATAALANGRDTLFCFLRMEKASLLFQ